MTTPTVATIEAEERVAIRRTSKGRLLVRRYMRNKPAVVGLVMLLLLVAFTLIGPMFAKYDYEELDFLALKEAPSGEHWFGTDNAGGDLYALCIRGLGRSLMIGFIASIGITVIAALVGTAVAYFGGWIEKVGTWILDMLLVIPAFLVIAIVTSSASGTNGWLWLTLALMLLGWVGYARVIRSVALSLREREYVSAAKFMGVDSFTILRRHLIPNLGSILIIHTVLGVVYAVELETALSFVGFGINPPDTSLGVLIDSGSKTLETAPWMFLIPAGLLVALCFAMTMIGDGLRDALDPSSESGGKA
ncbi:ABC transporter permease [Solicola gregarius]|uniref:Oligopeptide transport system permease protein OppC n=1 Tax=Solicola gregarius TaxID=2908642 RepID=A0AA46TEH6_9ACTN|nr:ABC transporter permease [Solicola gregarius]UYM03665.1 ABC transporter permease [Solicola gregarius]